MNTDRNSEESCPDKKERFFCSNFFNAKNIFLCLLPSLISLIIVSIVYTLTHENGKLLDKYICLPEDRVCGIYDIILKSNHEILAIILMGVTSVLFFYVVKSCKQSITKALFALSVAFLCREIHFTGTERGVYVAAALIAAWCFSKRKKIFSELQEYPQVKLTLIMTGTTYFFALLVQRRAFKKVLPESYKYLEKWIHIPLEEFSENAAHFCFLICAVMIIKHILKKED